MNNGKYLPLDVFRSAIIIRLRYCLIKHTGSKHFSCDNSISPSLVLLLSRFHFTVSISASSGALGSVLDKDFGNYSQQQGVGPDELQPELPLEGRHS